MVNDLYVHLLMASFVLIILLAGIFICFVYLFKKLRAKDAEKMKAVLRAEEKERTLIAREIHDNLGPLLSIAQLQLGYLSEAPTTSNTILLAPYLQQQLATAVTISRNISHELSPFMGTQKLLKDSLTRYVNQINATQQLHVSVNWQSQADPQGDAAITLFRILQELLQNTLKHAQASKAGIQLHDHHGHVSISYADNGIGFTIQQAGKGLGIQNIQSRVQSLKGKITWTEKKRQTSDMIPYVTILIPVTQIKTTGKNKATAFENIKPVAS